MVQQLEKTIPLELIKDFETGNGALYIGRGLSHLEGLPSWEECFKTLAQDLDEEDDTPANDEVLELYESEKGKMS